MHYEAGTEKRRESARPRRAAVKAAAGADSASGRDVTVRQP
jgi:hypothetical protein